MRRVRHTNQRTHHYVPAAITLHMLESPIVDAGHALAVLEGVARGSDFKLREMALEQNTIALKYKAAVDVAKAFSTSTLGQAAGCLFNTYAKWRPNLCSDKCMVSACRHGAFILELHTQWCGVDAVMKNAAGRRMRARTHRTKLANHLKFNKLLLDRMRANGDVEISSTSETGARWLRGRAAADRAVEWSVRGVRLCMIRWII